MRSSSIHDSSLSLKDWGVWEQWFLEGNDDNDMNRYSQVFRAIGYSAPRSLSLYRGLVMQMDKTTKILSKGFSMIPRKIASWTHNQDVAEEIVIVELNQQRRNFQPGNLCAGVIIQFKIPAKNIVWDSLDQDLIHLVEDKNPAGWEGDVKYNILNEEEVVVVDLPQYRLSRKQVVGLYMVMRNSRQSFEDSIRQLFDLPDQMFKEHLHVNGILRVNDRFNLDKIRVRR